MAMSDTAIAFSTIPADHQVRLEDRVSFAYVERARIVQDRTGVVALWESDGEYHKDLIQIPVGGIALLVLGPGTSITHPAITSCTRSGATVLFTGGGGVSAYSLAAPLTTSARWAIAQARLVSNERHQRTAAMYLYKRQFGLEEMEGGSIRTMRGLEGQRMKLLYRQLAQKHGIKGFRRRVEGTDPVNVALNLSNSLLYGCAASACAAIGVNPALGIIHRGDARSLLFDLADLYKPTVTIPISFACSHEEDVAVAVRKRVRKAIKEEKILSGMLDALMELLRPHLPNREDDRLIGDTLTSEEVGHTQYGSEEHLGLLESLSDAEKW